MRLLPTKGVDATPLMQYMSHEDDDDPAQVATNHRSTANVIMKPSRR
jgi:hypothetical protein